MYSKKMFLATRIRKKYLQLSETEIRKFESLNNNISWEVSDHEEVIMLGQMKKWIAQQN